MADNDILTSSRFMHGVKMSIDGRLSMAFLSATSTMYTIIICADSVGKRRGRLFTAWAAWELAEEN